MTENMKKFLAAVSKNDELIAKASAMAREELIALAKNLGIELTDADFAKPTGEMNVNELEAVTGGGECSCFAGGGGKKNGKNKVCACVLAGFGDYDGDYNNDDSIIDYRCYCVGYGTGDEGPA